MNVPILNAKICPIYLSIRFKLRYAHDCARLLLMTTIQRNLNIYQINPRREKTKTRRVSSASSKVYHHNTSVHIIDDYYTSPIVTEQSHVWRRRVPRFGRFFFPWRPTTPGGEVSGCSCVPISFCASLFWQSLIQQYVIRPISEDAGSS